MLRLSTSSDTESWRQVQNGEWFPISVGCRCHGRVHGEAMEAGRTNGPRLSHLFEKLEIVVYTGKIYKVGPPR